ncbi:MAG: hypothetical protein V4459_07785 [Pseudomonadota bacterium]
MDAPPSRYRVIERGGRLEVIDTHLGGAPQTAAELLPGLASDDAVEASEPAWQQQAEPEALAVPRPPFRPRAAETLIAGPPDLVRNIAATVCNDARDGDGRLLLTTATWYDRKGPRTIALDPRGERQLGTMVMVLLASAVAAIVAAVIFGWPGLILLGVGASQIGRFKTVATPWLDQLGVTPS